MAFTTCSVATNNIASLDDLPNDVGGLTATQLKEAFDKFGTEFVAWFNATHLAEVAEKTTVDAHLADEVHLGDIGSASSSSSTNTNSTDYVDLADMVVTINTNGGDIIVWFNGTFYSATIGTTTTVAVKIDSSAEIAVQGVQQPVANYFTPLGTVYRFSSVAAGSHTVKIRYKVGANTVFCPYRTMIAMEVKKAIT